MLYFSKIRIISIAIFTIFFVYLTTSNFLKFDDNIVGKNINLGLDLQGGSYLLLEIDNRPVITQNLQNKLSSLRKYFKNEEIKFRNLKIKNNNIISFELGEEFVEKFTSIIEDKNSIINPYYQKFKTHEFIFNVEDNVFNLQYSNYGLILLKESSLDQSLEIVRRRIDEIGTNEPNILKRGSDRILVELPGLDDPMRIKTLLGKTANLTFRFVVNTDEPSFGSEKLSFIDGSQDDVIVSKRIILSGDNLIDAKPSMDNQTNETVVSFNLDRVGSKRFGKATTTGVGKRLAIVLDGKVITAPVIRTEISGGAGVISGNFTIQEAQDLALLLRAGALPAPLEIIEERSVGAGLGADSISAGTSASMIGLILVCIFMFLIYGYMGLIANIALICNLFIILSSLSLIGATLTLPGIAGIVLTIGMAVDANVLIFERIKEEMSKNTYIISAINSGYSKAISTILDANITTLIAAIILFLFGSGPIKGFSITLSLGVIASMFTALILTKIIVLFWYNLTKPKKLLNLK